MGSPRRSLLVVLSWVALGCGGAGHDGSTTPPSGLGVQSNVAHREVTLRMHAAAPMAFATQMRVQLRAEMLGHPLDAAMETLGVRRVAPRDDGHIDVEEVDTQSTLTLSMMGRSRSGPAQEGPSATRHYVLGERGARVDRPSMDPSSYGLEAALDPLVRALELPLQPVAPGSEWRAEGRVPMSVLDPMLMGEAEFEVVQRLERFEGTGDQRVAIIAFEAVVEGMGEALAMQTGTVPEGTAPGMDPHAMPGPNEPVEPFDAPDPYGGAPEGPMPGDPMPGDPMPEGPMPGEPGPPPEAVGGRMEIRGFYVVALTDGFARMARAEIAGEARMGPGAMLLVPFAAALEWTATPIDTEIVIAPEPTSPATPAPVPEPVPEPVPGPLAPPTLPQ